ncbi:hypothetical protein P7K49_006662 [Saguinus oedipus]|uniref:Uncharacterized protein n=1 Tax=Saguinus oedipus TaxID=9490 RepID=A0ABQ9W335_SAGOE|nr:hypothetical protein P7K49_006662 [Saguinus oedipus]
MDNPDRGNLFSAWVLLGFGEAAELSACPMLLGICPSVGRPVLLLGMNFASSVFSEEWSSLKCPLQNTAAPIPLSLLGKLSLPVFSAEAPPSGSATLITPDQTYSPHHGQVYPPATLLPAPLLNLLLQVD